MASTESRRHIRAPRAVVYRALLDPDAIARWRAPDGMSCVVHELSPEVGGAIRVSLTYDAPTGSGKSSPQTDTYTGRFIRLAPDREVVEAIEFETADPRFAGTMTMTTTVEDADGGTDVTIRCENIPPGIRPADNQVGTRMALDNLAALVEAQHEHQR